MNELHPMTHISGHLQWKGCHTKEGGDLMQMMKVNHKVREMGK